MSSWRGRSIGDLSRRMTKQYRQRIKDRFAKRQEKRVVQKAAARVCQFVGLQGEVPKGDEGKAERLRHYYHHFVEPCICSHLSCATALKVYHSRVMKKDGSQGWQGGKNLPDTAVFTWQFCRAILRCWQNQPVIIEVSDSSSQEGSATDDDTIL